LKLFVCWGNKSHTNKCVRLTSLIRKKVIDIIFYKMYWRLLIEAHESLILSSTLEIKELNSSSTPEVLSLAIAWVVLGIWFIIPAVAFYLFYIYRKEYNPKKKHVLMEFFEGLKNKKLARLYTGVTFWRRIIFVWIVIFIVNSSDRMHIYIALLFIQAIYLSFIVSLLKIIYRLSWNHSMKFQIT